MSKPPESDELAASGDAALLVPGLVHEMRHPLTGIKAGLELLARDLGPALTGREEWELVRSQIRRLEETLQGFELLLEPGGDVRVPFDVEPVVRRAVGLLAFRVRRLGGRFAVAVEEGVPMAYGSPRALLHAVTNLVVNAIDAAEDAGACARVEVRLLPNPDAPSRPQVRVADAGSGIAPAHRARLFEPAFTTKGKGKGTGLGLHIARRMMAASLGGVSLLDRDPARRDWARTEFAIDLAPVPEDGP